MQTLLHQEIPARHFIPPLALLCLSILILNSSLCFLITCFPEQFNTPLLIFSWAEADPPWTVTARVPSPFTPTGHRG